jgi:hypothetical protein
VFRRIPRARARRTADRSLEIDAADVRFYAERRMGQMLIAQKETIALNRGRAGAGRPALGDTETITPKTDDRPIAPVEMQPEPAAAKSAIRCAFAIVHDFKTQTCVLNTPTASAPERYLEATRQLAR